MPRLSFLCTGVTLANFQYVGQSPCLKPQLISVVIEGARLSAHSFKIMFGGPSGQMDFLTLIDCRRDVIS